MHPALATARPPLDAAEIIPLGSRRPAAPILLRHTDRPRRPGLRAGAADRPRRPAPATLAGYRRVQAWVSATRCWCRIARGVVEGRLLRRATRRDIARINHFESGEYRAELQLRGHGRGGDAAGMALSWAWTISLATAEPWLLAAWQAMHKPGFFAACDGWMAGLPR